MIDETKLPADVQKIVKKAVESMANQTNELLHKKTIENNAKDFNYYKATEMILFNYPALKKIVAEKEKYLTVELQGKSKSVVRYSSNSGSFKSKDDIINDIRQQKQSSYDRTAADVAEIEKVLKQFEKRKEFIIIQMYYFGYDADAKPRAADAKPNTWESITADLAAKGILKEDKTARKWRGQIIKDIAVCLFGIPAALSVGLTRTY